MKSEVIHIFDEMYALDMAKRCSWCGFCESVCPTFLLTRDKALGPRGRVWIFIGLMTSKLSPSDISENTIKATYSCLTCKACINVCPVKIDVPVLMSIIRKLMVERWFHD